MQLIGYVSIEDFDGFVMPIFLSNNVAYYQDFDGLNYFASKYPYLEDVHPLKEICFKEFDLSKERLFAIKARDFVEVGCANEIIKVINEKKLFDYFEKEEIELFKKKYCSLNLLSFGEIVKKQGHLVGAHRPAYGHVSGFKCRRSLPVNRLTYSVCKRQTDGKWLVKYASGKKTVKVFGSKKEALSFAKNTFDIKAVSAHSKVMKTASSGKTKTIKKVKMKKA